jgi:hypothetical protein
LDWSMRLYWSAGVSATCLKRDPWDPGRRAVEASRSKTSSTRRRIDISMMMAFPFFQEIIVMH